MKNKKIWLLLLVVVLISGCTPSNNNLVGPDTGGIWQNLIKFSSYIVIWFSKIFDYNVIAGVVGLAVVFNIILLPFTISSQKFSQQMAQLQPQLEAINKKYERYSSDDTNAQMRKQQELAALYTRNKINPFKGCLPMLIQLPLLIAVYGGVTNLILYTTEVNGLTVHGDYLFGVELHAMLGSLNLGQVPSFTSVLILFPLASALLTYLSIKITTIGQPQDSNSTMKMMTLLQPFMTFFIGMQLPTVITVYWMTSTVIRTIITLWFKRGQIKQILDRKKVLNS